MIVLFYIGIGGGRWVRGYVGIYADGVLDVEGG